MIALILYQPGTPADHDIEYFQSRLEQFGVEVTLIDADSPEGSAKAQNYDLMSRPAVVLVRDDGSVVEKWEHSLPLAEDVSYLAHQ